MSEEKRCPRCGEAYTDEPAVLIFDSSAEMSGEGLCPKCTMDNSFNTNWAWDRK